MKREDLDAEIARELLVPSVAPRTSRTEQARYLIALAEEARAEYVARRRRRRLWLASGAAALAGLLAAIGAVMGGCVNARL